MSRAAAGPAADPNQIKLAHTQRTRRWTIAISVIGVIVVLAACAFGSYLVIKDDQREAKPKPSGPQKRDISSQTVDPNPLTEPELFPQKAITPVANEPAYQVLRTQSSADCKLAATDELGTLIVAQGCTQIIRGTLKHPTEQYLLTAGIFNLKDQASADHVHNNIKALIDTQKGRFNGLIAGSGTDAIVRAPTQLGWKTLGHYLAYCVVARADGKAFEANDAYYKQIIFDIVTTYLINGIVGAREAPLPQESALSSPTPASAQPTAKPAN